MGHHVRGPPAVLLGFGLEQPDPEDVVDVAVGEDRGVKSFARPTSQFSVHLVCGERRTGVDHEQAVVGLKGRTIGEGRQKGDAVGYLGEVAPEDDWMVFLYRDLAAPEALGEFNDVHEELPVGLGLGLTGLGRGLVRGFRLVATGLTGL